MKSEIEIYLHGAGTTEEKIIKVPEDATVHDVIEAARKIGLATGEGIIISIEDADEALKKDDRLHVCGVKNKHHLHCHTCSKVEVTVHFNGQSKTHGFAPGKKVKGVLKWAVGVFGLNGVDAENKELRIGIAGGKILNAQQHIGSFVNAPGCHLELYLTGIVEVQG